MPKIAQRRLRKALKTKPEAVTNGVKETAEDATGEATTRTEDLPNGEEAVNGVKDTAEDVVDEAEDTAEGVAKGLPEIDLERIPAHAQGA